jgi:glycosyltransferase involved in cell wall biosynthesis
MNKKKVLFYCVDQAGVFQFRILCPMVELDRNHSDEFHCDIETQLDFNDPNLIEKLKQYDIIHYHRQLAPSIPQMLKIAKELREAGVILVVDIDDYWHLDKKHPMYSLSIEHKMHQEITDNLKIADYVTTTTDIFAEEIKKTTGKDNVIVLYNAINPDWMKQFQDNRKPDPDGLVRISYCAGSSHLGDVQQLEGVINMLEADVETKGKYKINLIGWDSNGTTQEVVFNQELMKELQARNIWDQKIIDYINKCKGDIDKIPIMPNDLKTLYKGKVFTVNQRQIKADESVYYQYEKILTDNYKLLKDDNYKRWLMNFQKLNYPGKQYFSRIWTRPANTYAESLDQTDIVIAPLDNNKFNSLKSNLKQVECWSRKLPIVCSDMPPYNIFGKNNENCILIKTEKNTRDWKNALKKLILDKELRDKLGNQLYEDFKEKYHLTTVTKKRAEFYNKITNK